VIAAAIWVSSQRHLSRDVDIGNKLFPDLKLGEIREIDVTRGSAKRVVTLEIREDAWTVAEREHYPPMPPRSRPSRSAWRTLRIVEEKTSDPKNYAALAVEDIAEPAAGGAQVDLKSATGIASLIIGRNSGGHANFVRKPAMPGAC